jgi:hypothetical protein
MWWRVVVGEICNEVVLSDLTQMENFARVVFLETQDNIGDKGADEERGVMDEVGAT